MLYRIEFDGKISGKKRTCKKAVMTYLKVLDRP
jgi:hypothetical protein